MNFSHYLLGVWSQRDLVWELTRSCIASTDDASFTIPSRTGECQGDDSKKYENWFQHFSLCYCKITNEADFWIYNTLLYSILSDVDTWDLGNSKSTKNKRRNVQDLIRLSREFFIINKWRLYSGKFADKFWILITLNIEVYQKSALITVIEYC